MRTIQLTQGKVALVDDSDYEWLNQWKWLAHKERGTYYALRSVRIKGRLNRKVIRMHRLIMNTPDNMLTDHRNHDGLNNQRYNLRVATPGQNQHNRLSWGKSKFLGVGIVKTGINKGQITAQIHANGKKIHLGNFPTEEAAARVYDVNAKELFGEFANLNFPI